MTPSSMLIMNVFAIVYSFISFSILFYVEKDLIEGKGKNVISLLGIVFAFCVVIGWLVLPFTIYNFFK